MIKKYVEVSDFIDSINKRTELRYVGYQEPFYKAKYFFNKMSTTNQGMLFPNIFILENENTFFKCLRWNVKRKITEGISDCIFQGPVLKALDGSDFIRIRGYIYQLSDVKVKKPLHPLRHINVKERVRV